MYVTGMDSLSLFHDQTPAANEAVSVIATMLAAADALASTGNLLASLNKAIGFSLFQADEWGFAGSRRFVSDLVSFTCSKPVAPADSPDHTGACLNPVYPSLAFQEISLNNLEVIAIDQLGLAPAPGATTLDFSAIVQSTTDSANVLTALHTAATSLGPQVTLTTTQSATAMPPTPLTSFLKESNSLHSAVLAGYVDTSGGANPFVFNDPRYHSHLDTTTYLDPTTVTTSATLLARSLFSLAGGADASLTSINADDSLVRQLCHCLTEDFNCPLFKPFITSEKEDLEHYLGGGVYIAPVPSPPSYYSGVLAYYQGQPMLLKKSQGSSQLFGAYSGSDPFDPEQDKVRACCSSGSSSAAKVIHLPFKTQHPSPNFYFATRCMLPLSLLNWPCEVFLVIPLVPRSPLISEVKAVPPLPTAPLGRVAAPS